MIEQDQDRILDTTHARDQQAVAATTSAQQSATAEQQAAAAAALPPAPALPLGTVVPALPTAGCVSVSVENVAYNHCGNDYYRAVFQGNDLVYVTTATPE